MKPGPFTYHDPTTVDELLPLLGSLEDAKLLAGGQSLMPMLNLRLAQPDHVIDLNTVTGLDGIDADDSVVRLGAMTRQATLERHPAIAQRLPIMVEALQWVGHFQTRTRGTLGGSMVHLDPASELPVVALLHDANLSVRGQDGTRTVPIAEWPIAYMIPNIAQDEVLTEIEFTPWQGSHGYAFEEFARRHGDFAIVAVGAMLAVADGQITRAAVAIAGAQPTPSRMIDVETALVGQAPTAAVFEEAAEAARGIDAMSDAYVDGSYRKRLAAVLVKRALTRAAERAGEAVAA